MTRSDALSRVSPRSLADRVAWWLGTWWGTGLSPIAPGTVGTLATLPFYFAVRSHGAPAVLALAVVVTVVGIWAAGRIAKMTNADDPQIVVIDEAAGVLLPLSIADGPTAIVVAVLLFRLFDITKPFPARAAERLPGGYGIMVDDLVAGLWAGGVLLLLRGLEILA